MVAQEDVTRRRMSVEKWRELLAHSDVKYEYHHGWAVAMAGRAFDHATIAINVIEDLRSALRGQPCRVSNVEVYRRVEPRWTFESYGPGETVVLETLGARLPVDQLYRLTEVPLPDPVAGAPGAVPAEGRSAHAPAEWIPDAPEG